MAESARLTGLRTHVNVYLRTHRNSESDLAGDLQLPDTPP